MEKSSFVGKREGRKEETLQEENARLRRDLKEAEAEIEELLQELEEKAMALASLHAQAPSPPPPAEQKKPPSDGVESQPRLTSLIRSALAAGSSQSKIRAATLEEELDRQAARHAAQIAELEANFVARLAEVAGAGDAAVFKILQERIVELERERADPPLLAQARATIGRLQAEVEELRGENRFLSAEVERWAALAQDKG